jgi:cytoskeletal protein CcmA (bactofilin family)
MKIKYVLGVFLAVIISIFFMAGTAQAKEMRSGTNVDVGKNELIDSSLTVTATKINIEGTVNGNLYCSGQDVTISGKINGSVYCAGTNVNVTGRIDGDLFVLAQNMKLSSAVNGNVNIAASTIDLDSKTRIRQDLYAAGGNVTIDGLIARDVTISANTARVGAIIGRNLEGNYNSLELTSSADIRGEVKYSSNKDLKKDSGAKVKGNITKSQMAASGMKVNGFAAIALSFLIMLISLLIVSLTTVLFMPNFYIKAKDQIHERMGATVGWGFFNLIIIPILALLLLFTVVGVPLAGLILIAWVLSLMLSGPVFAYFIGSKIIKDKKKHFATMLVGSLIVLVLYIVPIVNVVLATIVAVVGSGSLFNMLKDSKLRPKKA